MFSRFVAPPIMLHSSMHFSELASLHSISSTLQSIVVHASIHPISSTGIPIVSYMPLLSSLDSYAIVELINIKKIKKIIEIIVINFRFIFFIKHPLSIILDFIYYLIRLYI